MGVKTTENYDLTLWTLIDINIKVLMAVIFLSPKTSTTTDGQSSLYCKNEFFSPSSLVTFNFQAISIFLSKQSFFCEEKVKNLFVLATFLFLLILQFSSFFCAVVTELELNVQCTERVEVRSEHSFGPLTQTKSS